MTLSSQWRINSFSYVDCNVSAIFENVMQDYFRILDISEILPFMWPLWSSFVSLVCFFHSFFSSPPPCSSKLWRNPRWTPSSLGPWWAECTAAPFIAVMALRARSQTIQTLTSPPLVCTAPSRRGGMQRVKWLVYRPPFSMTHHENKSARGLNDHIHLNRALSDVVLEKNPNQQLTVLLTTTSVTTLWRNG